MASISMIFVSEIGDKTFFIAAIMAMRHNRFQIFTAALLGFTSKFVVSSVKADLAGSSGCHDNFKCRYGLRLA